MKLASYIIQYFIDLLYQVKIAIWYYDLRQPLCFVLYTLGTLGTGVGLGYLYCLYRIKKKLRAGRGFDVIHDPKKRV